MSEDWLGTLLMFQLQGELNAKLTKTKETMGNLMIDNFVRSCRMQLCNFVRTVDFDHGHQ